MVVARSGYVSKVGIVLALCLADVVLNGISDDAPANGFRSSAAYLYGVIGAQLLIQLLNLLMIFMLFFGTYLFQVGLIGVLMKEFQGVLYVMPLYAGVYVAYAATKLVRHGISGGRGGAAVAERTGHWRTCTHNDVLAGT